MHIDTIESVLLFHNHSCICEVRLVFNYIAHCPVHQNGLNVSPFFSVTCVLLFLLACVRACVCVQVYVILLHGQICGATTRVKTENVSITTRIPSAATYIPLSMALSLPPSPTRESILHLFNFVVAKILCKWNCILCNFLKFF